MDDILQVTSQETHIRVDNETPVLSVEPDNNNAFLDELEGAYRYELWRCLQAVQAMRVQLDELQELLEGSLEEITQSEVQSMWT